MKALITGATGFIGCHLTRRLISEGMDVHILSRKSSNAWRINDCLSQLTIVPGDITNKDLITKIIKELKPDTIFHLAAYGVSSKNEDYIDAINTNIVGAANLISAAIDAGTKLFVNTGSYFEYGQKIGLVSETDFLEPTNIYSSTKAASTLLAHQMASGGGLKIVTLRPFGVYGEAEKGNRLFPHVIFRLLDNKIPNLTKCTQERDYVYVHDLIDAYLLASKSKSLSNEIINIGSGESKPLNYFIEVIKEKINPGSSINYGAMSCRSDEALDLYANIEKAKKLLNWAPKTSFDVGITKTIDWFKGNKSHYNLLKR